MTRKAPLLVGRHFGRWSKAVLPGGLARRQVVEDPLWLYPQVIVQRSDLTRVATVLTDQGRHLMRFQLNSLSLRKLAEVSSGNVGILLVLVMKDQAA